MFAVQKPITYAQTLHVVLERAIRLNPLIHIFTGNSKKLFYIYFADRASQYIYLNINQLDALNFIMSLFHASTCFGHMCSSSGVQNCTIQPPVSSHLPGIITPIGVMIPEAVKYNFDLLTMTTFALNV